MQSDVVTGNNLISNCHLPQVSESLAPKQVSTCMLMLDSPDALHDVAWFCSLEMESIRSTRQAAVAEMSPDG